jgi:hypothetical protein
MCEQQIIYFIFLAACYIVILILQTYFKQEKDALHNKNILYYIWYRLLLTIKVCFFFWATLYGSSRVFLNDAQLVIIYVSSDMILLYQNYPFYFVLFLIFCVLYFRTIYYLAEKYHHIYLFFSFWIIFGSIYILENYLI